MTAPSQTASASRSIPSLDGLRAISIAFVLACHGAHLSDYERVLTPFAPLGTFGVHVFFVISGYLITTLLLRELDDTSRISLGGFYFRRALRIFPAYFVYLGAAAALVLLGAVAVSATARWWPALTYTSNVFFTREWLTGHSWSLAVEEQFYLTWPFAIAWLGRKRAGKVAMAMIIVAPLTRVALFAATRDGHLAEGSIGYDFIAWGCLLALYGDRLRDVAVWQRLMRSAWIAPALFVLAAVAREVFGASTRWMWAADILVEQAFEGLALVIVVAWAVNNPATRVGRVLNAKPVRWIGLLSYSLYLWQQVFLREGSWFSGWGAFIAAFGAAAASYYLVEKPALRMRGRIEAAWRARHSSATPGGDAGAATPVPV